MEAKATARYVRVTPRKVGQVAGVVRGKSVAQALSQLRWMKKASTPILEKVIRSAFANFQRKQVASKPESVWLSELTVNGGPMFRIFIPRAMGRASGVRKRSCHITAVVTDETRKKGS